MNNADPTTLTPGIRWDRARLKRFKKAFARAVWRNTMESKEADKDKTFSFEGHEYLLEFAGFLISHLDAQFNGKKS